MEESWEEVRCADSALRKEANGGVPFCNTATIQRGLECKGVFNSTVPGGFLQLLGMAM